MDNIQELLESCATLSLPDLSQLLHQQHGIDLTVKQLSTLSLRAGISRRGTRLTADTVVITNTIKAVLKDLSTTAGYRTVWQTLNTQFKLNVRQSTVMKLMRDLDPAGVSQRKHRTLRRRQYYAEGPNYVWHIDGYDKLKKYGFAIHGCIDGFSRKVLWLEIGPTNNNPKVIGGYFLKHVERLGGVPRVIRSDRGTENIHIERIQKAFRSLHHDPMSTKPYLYGTSTKNQRIERFWRSLKEGCIQPILDQFDSLEQKGQLSTGDECHTEALRFCYMSVIRKKLQDFVDHWNRHRIRKNKRGDCHGVPMVLYSQDPKKYLYDLDRKILQEAKMYTQNIPDVSATFTAFAEEILEKYACFDVNQQLVIILAKIEQLRQLPLS